MKSSYTSRSEKILKIKYAFSTFAYEFLLTPFKSGVTGFVILLAVITAVKLFSINNGESISPVFSMKDIHISLAGFFAGYAIRLFKNIEK